MPPEVMSVGSQTLPRTLSTRSPHHRGRGTFYLEASQYLSPSRSGSCRGRNLRLQRHGLSRARRRRVLRDMLERLKSYDT